MVQTKVTTSHWGAFKVTFDGERILSVAPFDSDPDPSGIASILPQAVHHASRVARPAIRKSWLEGERGRRCETAPDSFVEMAWDEALDIAADEIMRVKRSYGNTTIFGGSYGWSSAGRFHHAQGQVHRFLNCAGGYVRSFGSYSTGAAQVIIPHVFGMSFNDFIWNWHNSWESIVDHTETLVMFGGINKKNAQVNAGGISRHNTGLRLGELANKRARLVTISPQSDDGPEQAEWLPIVPGTDVALMLGIAHVLEECDLVDRGFLAECCVGYDKFRPYLLGQNDGQPKSPDWAQAICGIDADTIRELARRMAATRTLITASWSLQRAQNGEQPYWMAATLSAMLGQIGLPGGGIGYGYGAVGGIGTQHYLPGGCTLPQGQNPVEAFIPVARIADMLLNPGADYEFNGSRMTYPDIRLIYWCGGNPFHHHQDLGRLERAWNCPETVIVNEPWWTATAKRADIVFPATTPYEREDIGREKSDPFLFHMPQLIPPVAEARNDYDIFCGLAARLEIAEVFTEGRSDAEWLRHLYSLFRETCQTSGVDIPDFDVLKRQNWVELSGGDSKPPVTPFAEFRKDPCAFPLQTPSGRIEIYSDVIAGFGYAEYPGHPCWREPDEWLGSPEAQSYPLHLVSPQPGDKLHSQLEAALADQPDARPERVVMHPEDAESRGIFEGALVEIHNSRGICIARARISRTIRPGVVALPTGAWYDPGPDGVDQQGNPNVLTRDLGTSWIGQGSSAHTALVEIRLKAR